MADTKPNTDVFKPLAFWHKYIFGRSIFMRRKNVSVAPKSATSSSALEHINLLLAQPKKKAFQGSV